MSPTRRTISAKARVRAEIVQVLVNFQEGHAERAFLVRPFEAIEWIPPVRWGIGSRSASKRKNAGAAGRFVEAHECATFEMRGVIRQGLTDERPEVLGRDVTRS